MSILKVSTRQIKAARALLNWSQSDLARESGVSEPTIKRLEAVDGALGGSQPTAEKILDCFHRAGIEFLDGPGVKIRKLQL